MTAALFTPITLGGMEFPNRIAIPPMCQYSADDGSATDWHLQHWMNLAMSGAGMITMEATGVERRGRITHGCLGLYSEANEAAAERALTAAKRVAAPGAKFGVQLAHAGRKASSQRPWEGGGPLNAEQDPWQTVAPSAVPIDDSWHTPEALDESGIRRVINAFATAAQRAERAGYDFVELHGAHGYLMHEFLSPISNKRTDSYGGSLQNRMRLTLEIAEAVRAALPARMMMGVRLSATDWVDGGFNIDEAVTVASALKEAGAAYICASSGGVSPHQKIPPGLGYQVHLAERIRKDAAIPTRAVGLITGVAQAEAIVAEGRADMVALGRALLADPRWPWRAAAELGVDYFAPPQYLRSTPTMNHWAAELKAATSHGN